MEAVPLKAHDDLGDGAVFHLGIRRDITGTSVGLSGRAALSLAPARWGAGVKSDILRLALIYFCLLGRAQGVGTWAFSGDREHCIFIGGI